jgi:hypothetical protein
MRRLLLAMLMVGSTGTATLARAQSAPPAGCPGAEARQFDFWVGNWDVTVGTENAGTNNVTLEEDRCVIHEHWTGSRGGTGQSFNFYDRAIGKWHQFWVDNAGNYLHLTGSYADGRLVLTGVAPGPDGKPAEQRLTFFSNSDGTVRQLWETSSDHGATWQVAFDGLYRKH